MRALRRSWSVALLLLASCGGGAPPVNAPTETAVVPPSAPDVGDAGATEEATPKLASYPPTYRAFSEAELADAEGAAMKKNAGWRLDLESVGFLARAHLNQITSGPAITPDERARVMVFLHANEDIVGGKVSTMKLLNERPDRLFYQQIVAGSVVSFLTVEKANDKVTISGHFWPHYGTPAVRSDAELRPLLEKEDPEGKALELHHGIRMIGKPSGPIEVHLALCFKRPGPWKNGVPHPICVDAVNGEPLRALVSMGVHHTTQNGTSVTTHTIDPASSP
jgi:hypothetical protein